MAEEVVVEKKEEDWMQKKWRPAMGWMYMMICTLDMIIFPVLWALLQAALKQPVTQWNPLTLQGAGLFHLAMGAVLGIAAWGRTQEKVAGAASNTTPVPYTPPAMAATSSLPMPDPIPTPSAEAAPTTDTPRPRPRPSL